MYVRALLPLRLDVIVVFVTAFMGVGRAFLMVPAMTYLLGMATERVPGASLFVDIFVRGFVTISHAFAYRAIDLVLVLIFRS